MMNSETSVVKTEMIIKSMKWKWKCKIQDIDHDLKTVHLKLHHLYAIFASGFYCKCLWIFAITSN